ERRRAVETLLAPLRETLGRLDQRTAALEQARVEAYSGLSEQLKRLSLTTGDLQERTSSLATALRGSGAKGRWGEVALRNVAELAGMSEHCDFVEQTAVEGGRRPDMTVRLPGNRWIAVDAKAPLRAYLDAVEATDSGERRKRLDEHVRALRQHVRDLAQRDYASSLPGEIDLVVLFLPGDAFLAAAFEHEPELQVEALRSKVLLATPTTLVALLRTVAIYWQQRSLAEHAEEIAGVARELYDRAAKLGEELDGVGRGLQSALDAYNRAVGSFKHRLLPMSSRLEQLKVTEQSRRELAAPEEIDTAPRSVP
ncbi:MAG: DNA recombination protein RmuC, partial [Thermoanaerobaculia bacterium]